MSKKIMGRASFKYVFIFIYFPRDFYFVLLFFKKKKTGFLCVTILSVLELTLQKRLASN